jgi:hypothetical protein
VPFIFNSWLKSYRNANACKSISNPVYFDFQHKLIEKILKRSQVEMLCSPDDPTQVYGYIVSERIEGVIVLHYCYVKYAFRGIGLCSMLMQHIKLDKQAGGFYTHDTHAIVKVLGKSNFVYNPYLAYL